MAVFSLCSQNINCLCQQRMKTLISGFLKITASINAIVNNNFLTNNFVIFSLFD